MATTLGQGPKTMKQCEGIAQYPVIDVDLDPRESITTVAVLYAVALGYRWGIPNPFLDLVEELRDGRIERRVHWIFDSGSAATIEGERVGFGEFWRRVNDPESNHAGTVLCQLAQSLRLLETLPPGDRCGRLLEWADDARLGETARKVFGKAAEIYEQFLKDRPLRFLLVQETRGRTTTRCHIPLNATPEERAKALRKAGLA